MAWDIEAFHSVQMYDCKAHVPWPTLFFLFDCGTYICSFIQTVHRITEHTLVQFEWHACHWTWVLPILHFDRHCCSCVLCATLYIWWFAFISYHTVFHTTKASQLLKHTVSWWECMGVYVCYIQYSKWKAFKCCWVLSEWISVVSHRMRIRLVEMQICSTAQHARSSTQWIEHFKQFERKCL